MQTPDKRLVTETALNNGLSGKAESVHTHDDLYANKSDLVFNVKDFGAVGDGVTDDNLAIRDAVAASAGKVLYFPAGTYYYKASGHLAIPAGTTLRGEPGRTKIRWEVVNPVNHYNFASAEGDDVTVEGLSVERIADFPCIFFVLRPYSGFTMRDCLFDGSRDLYANYAHWLQIPTTAGTLSDVTIEHTTVRKMSYGLYQNNDSTVVTRNVLISQCTFEQNHSTDLEFNSPVTDTFDVTVSECAFSDNNATAAAGGFAVGLAHVTRVLIRGNTFNGYGNEAIHMEDWSSRVTVEGNIFTRCGLDRAGNVRITSGSDNIIIRGNDFDATDNVNLTDWHVIHSTNGGGTTVGGRVAEDPERVIITNNNIFAGKANAIYMSFAKNSIIADNVLIGAGAVASGVYDDANASYAIELHGGTDVKVTGNTVRGFRSMIPRHTTGTSTGGEGLTVANNTVSDCKFGVSVINNGVCVITGNMIRNTVHPLIVGQGSGTAKPAIITDNHADSCKYRMEIGGVLMVIATAAALDGATSITVEPLGMAISASHTIAFPSGAVFTPATGGATTGVTTINGTLTGGAVAAGDAGVITNLWHSWSGSTNRAVISGNIDSVAKVYGDTFMYSANGTRHRLTISDDGSLTTTTI